MVWGSRFGVDGIRFQDFGLRVFYRFGGLCAEGLGIRAPDFGRGLWDRGDWFWGEGCR